MIKVNFDDIIYLLDQKEKTAKVFCCEYGYRAFTIPLSINYQSTDYIVTDILENAFENVYINLLNFAQDSKVRTIHKSAFKESYIDKIEIPSSLTELQEGWCKRARISKVSISPNNPYFKLYNDLFILGKSRKEQENFDVLYFCDRNVEFITIPNFIEIIESYAFEFCERLKYVEIPNDSKLRIIKKCSFHMSGLKSFTIPSNLEKLEEKWNKYSIYMKKINISPNNQYFKIYENKFVLGKSKKEQENFDVLHFCNDDIEFVTIPNFIEIIEPYAFDECINLKQIEIPSDSKLRIIKEGVFSGSSIKSITLPSSLTDFKKSFYFLTELCKVNVSPNNQYFKVYEDKFVLGKSRKEQENFDVLYFCNREVENAIIPNYIEIIESYAFNECKNLKQIEFSNDSKLRIIKKYAFSHASCNSIKIPESVTEIEKKAFSYCRINEIEFSKDSKISIINDELFIGSSISSIKFSSNIIKIGKRAFNNCFGLQKIEFPHDSKLQIIDDEAFYESYIESITFPSELIQIGKSAFRLCRYLNHIEFPSDSKLQIIGVKAFEFTNTESITIPSQVTRIGKYAFNTSEFKQINFSMDSKLQILEIETFANSLISTITIPSNLIELQEGWCNSTKSLTKVNVSPNNQYFKVYEDKFVLGKSRKEQENFDVLYFCNREVENAIIPNYIEIIESYAFNKCKNLKQIEFSNDSKLRIIKKYAFSGTKIENIKIPENVTLIGDNAFDICNILQQIEIPKNSKLQIIGRESFANTNFESIFIPSNVIIIGNYAFYNCKKLKRIEFAPDSHLQTIDDNAFIQSSIESIIIPSSVTQIKQKAFWNCYNLKRIEFPADSNVQAFERETFQQTSIASLTIPSSLIELQEGWCFAADKLIKVNVSPNNQYFKVYEDKFVLGKSRKEQENFDVLYFCNREVENAIIPNYIEIIESYAFNKCKNLKQIEFSNDSKLRIIKNDAFSYLNIKKIRIPSTVTHICQSSFLFCENLEQIEIPNDTKLQEIGNIAFYNTAIESFTIPSSVTYIGDAFSGCEKLRKIEIPPDSKMKIFEEKAFKNTSIKSLYVPPKIKLIKEKSFDANNLQIIEFDENSEIFEININMIDMFTNEIVLIMVPVKINDRVNFDDLFIY